ncbi:MAG TPA: PilZ domain-containing protein [Gemmataceae bacterium]|jgi:hypothetical protein|nr:PilZ domain-containing protein [Gemmataceae bacterium]
MKTHPIARLRQILPSAQRRGQERSPCDLDVSVRLLRARAAYFWTARVWDISASGISLQLKEEIRPGTMLEIEILKREAVARKLLGRVAHATEHPGGTWIIGCDLDRRLTDAELRALTD